MTILAFNLFSDGLRMPLIPSKESEAESFVRKIIGSETPEHLFLYPVGEVKAIRDISFAVDRGEFVGIVGESGSGKSVTSLSILRLLQYPGKVTGGGNSAER